MAEGGEVVDVHLISLQRQTRDHEPKLPEGEAGLLTF